MKPSRRTFRASFTREGSWIVAQCLEVDVASQGKTEVEALANLKEALELHLEEPVANRVPTVRNVRVSLA